MQIEPQKPDEVLKNLRPYFRTQRITVVIEKTNGKIITGDLTNILSDSIEVQDTYPPTEIAIREIKEIKYGRLLEAALATK